MKSSELPKQKQPSCLVCHDNGYNALGLPAPLTPHEVAIGTFTKPCPHCGLNPNPRRADNTTDGNPHNVQEEA